MKWRNRMRLKKYMLLAMLCLILVALPSNAQIGEKLSIHGFGGWGYGKTDGNKYLIGNEEGSFRNSKFALNITAKPYEKLTINTQLYTEAVLTKDKIELDYAFFEWAFSDALKLRIGKVKCPFGIYSEVFDVGTVRPFFELPQSIYGKKGVTNKSYYGIGVTGNFFLNNNWSVQYDIYGGELVFQDWINQVAVPIPYPPYLYEVSIETTSFDEDMIGTRLIIHTPLEGLNLGVSYFNGRPKFLIDGELTDAYIKPGRFFDWDLHVEYLTDSFSLRSEYLYAGRMEEKDLTMKGAYIETAYKFLTNWQIAFQYNTMNMEIPSYEAYDQSQYEHKEFALGLNYWVNPDLVFKVAFHKINGNYLATPESILEALMSGGLEHNTNLFTAGMQFSF